jgi:hypothetical protein
MAEYLDKWGVVDKLIRLENKYNFFKKKWGKETLYRKICELEIELAKTAGLEIVRCKDCKFWFRNNGHDKNGCPITNSDIWMGDSAFCSYGERRDK